MATLICGSLAYDNIMTFEGRFREHILPEQVHILNVSFLVPTMRREFGGCAGNIAYALNLLGGEARIMGAIGAVDAQLYLDRLAQLDLSTENVLVVPDTYSAQAMITTDLENNQITAFHPGAMMQSHQNRADEVAGLTLGIVAPDGYDGMVQHSEQLAAAGVPFIFDPGQGLPLFDGETLRRIIELATYVAVNDYEAALVSNKTGWSIEQIAGKVDALIITLGEKGAQIHHGGGYRRDSGGHGQAGARSHRLRRRVSRRLALRYREGSRVGHDRPSRQPDGRTEDRASRPAKLRAQSGGNQRAVQAGLRIRPALISRAMGVWE
ncbi:adenosine kinase [Paraburkholderia sp. MM6662-R1]